jgi:hypothetical protein
MSVSVGDGVRGPSVRGHCFFGGMFVLSGAIVGGCVLNSVLSGALCGVGRYVVNWTAIKIDSLVNNSKSYLVATVMIKVATGIFNGLVLISVFESTGVLCTSTPIARGCFVILNYVFDSALMSAVRRLVNVCLVNSL